MKVQIILNNGEKLNTWKDTAKKLVEMGKAKYPGKTDPIAEERQTKVIEPEQKKVPKKRGRKPKNYENTSNN